MNYDVSVIIPVYNVELYIEQCLNSVFNQTLKNIHVIIVNDGSTDNSDVVIRKILNEVNKDNVIYITQENQGVSVSRNVALQYVKGEYVLFVDPDDYLDNKCIEKMYKKAKSIDADIVISGHRKVFDDSIEGVDEDVFTSLDPDVIYDGHSVAEKVLELDITGYLWDKLFRVSLIKEYELKFEPNRYIQDWYPVFKQIYNSKKIGYINESLYYYRQRGTSTVNKNNNKLLKAFNHAANSILKYINLNNLNLNKDSVIAFKSTTFNSAIKMYSEINKNEKISIYSKFYENNYGINEPRLLESMTCKKTTFRTKMSILLWKLRIRGLLFNR